MKKILYILLFIGFNLGLKAQHGHEVLTDLHLHSAQYQQSLKWSNRQKSAGDTIKHFKFNSLDLPFLDDFSNKKYFFNYLPDEYTCPTNFHFVKFLVDDSYMESFTGTLDSTVRITRVQQADSSWVIQSTLTNPSYQIKFFNYDNPTVAYDTGIYYRNFNILDSIYLNGTLGSALQYVDSVVFVNDSFTLYHCFPNDTFLWEDNDVFVNNDYPIQPPTLGVATFDGADSSGMPYDWSIVPNYFPHGIADYLTSVPINLGIYEESDSVYLSFFYQAQGRGANAPQNIDSLVLQFRLSDGNWTNIWYSEGYSLPSMTEDEGFNFQSVLVDSAFLYDGFQFRFLNWATLTGAVDLWHLDMVRLDKNRTAQDKNYSDFAFVYNYHSLLNEYQSVPYPHYSVKNELEYMIGDTVNPYVHNLKDSILSIGLYYSQTGTGMPYMQTGMSSGNLAGNSICTMNQTCYDLAGANIYNLEILPAAYEYPSNAGGNDSADYFFRIFKEANNSDFNHNNDTIVFHQKFYNYYAYDDGTAENGYGLNVNNALLAMRFKIYKADYLRAVAMYFDPMTIDFFSENSPYYFTLKVWTGAEYPETVVYEKDSLRPQFGSYDFYTRINDFAYYFIDTNLFVDTGGYVFVGWQQQTNQVFGLGFDRNINSNENMFFDIQDGNGWYQSQLPGSWMIRPCFGDTFSAPIGMKDVKYAENFTIVPNPANESLRLLSGMAGFEKNCTAQFLDISGRVVLSGSAGKDFQLNSLQNGVYFVRILEGDKAIFKTQKLVISH